MVGFCMKVGDLVIWKPSLPLNVKEEAGYGIITEILKGGLVGVWWLNSEFIYMEPAQNLEVING